MRPSQLMLLFLTQFACASQLEDIHTQSFESLVSAERAFASTSVTKDTRAAFLEFLSDDAILFADGPVDGRALWQARPETESVLEWGPEIATVSGAGDMGFTSGPWEVKAAADSAPVGWGHYVSVWGRNSDGTWRVLADGGVSHGIVPVHSDLPVLNVGNDDRVGSGVEGRSESDSISLLTTDADYSRAVSNSGFPGAMDAYAHQDVRFYRNGRLPIVGRDSARVVAQVIDAAWVESQFHGASVSQSGDLGFTFGVVTFAPETEASGTGEASYFRIWTRGPDSDWRVAIDVLTPFASTPE